MNYVEEILDNKGSAEDKFFAVADLIADKESHDTFSGLKVEEKNIYMIDRLLNEINNGGLDQYFFNTRGKFCQDTIDILKMLEQFELAEILNQAGILFHGDAKEEDKFDMLNEFDEKIYTQVNFDRLYEACVGYLRSYRQKFN